MALRGMMGTGSDLLDLKGCSTVAGVKATMYRTIMELLMSEEVDVTVHCDAVLIRIPPGS